MDQTLKKTPSLRESKTSSSPHHLFKMSLSRVPIVTKEIYIVVLADVEMHCCEKSHAENHFGVKWDDEGTNSAGGPNSGLKGMVDPIGPPHAALLSMKEIDKEIDTRRYTARVCTNLLF